MAHYANINFDNVVTNVLVVDNSITDPKKFLSITLGLGGNWYQTSYNTRGGIHYDPDGQPDGEPQLGYNYAGIGYNYDPVANAFYATQPYPSWTLDTSTYLWNPPVPYPSSGGPYVWDESTLSWVLIHDRTRIKNDP